MSKAIDSETCDGSFLIIAGSYRCGSTALFAHLAKHPEVAASEIKETGYFMPTYMRPGPPTPLTYGVHPLSAYLDLFGQSQSVRRRVRVEATPGYLYVPDAAVRIRKALPEARIVLSLREPVSRLVSWYQTLKLLSQIDRNLSFENFLSMQVENNDRPSRADFIVRARQHGAYAPYVRRYFDVFGRDRVLVTFLSDLDEQPRKTLKEVASFAGIDPGYYENYAVARVNAAKRLKSQSLHDTYANAKAWLRSHIKRHPGLQKRLHALRLRFEPRFYELISAPADRVHVSPDVERQLRDYYGADAEELSSLLGQDVPWLHQYAAR